MAEVCRLPNAAIVGRHVEDVGLGRNSGNCHGSAAAKRADQAPVKFLVGCGIILLGEKCGRKKE